jgi:hypothetical protein
MADIETGHRWWIRYVVVPLVVALVGGLVFLNRANKSVIKVPHPTSEENAEKSESVEVTATAVGMQAADDLYVVDEHGNSFLKDVKVRRGSVFTAKWDTRDASTGQVHFLLLGTNGHLLVNTKVGQKGQQKISSDDPITVKLAEEHSGKLRLIKAMSVQVY